jgi:hypothetical protein
MRIKYTTRQNALNPVARSVAQAKLAQSFLLQKLKLYSWEEGAACAAPLREVANTLAVLALAARLDPLQKNNRHLPEVDYGIELCSTIASTGMWRPDAAPAIEEALDAALNLYKRVNPRFIAKAA